MSKEKNPLIIERADLLSRRHKLTAAGITLFFWAALLYLWQPVISLLAWSINIRLFYNHMIVLGGYQSFLNLLSFYALVVAILGGGLILWAKSNQWRFRGKSRRGESEASSAALDCELLGLTEDSLRSLRQQRRVLVDIDAEGQVQDVTNSVTMRVD